MTQKALTYSLVNDWKSGLLPGAFAPGLPGIVSVPSIELASQSGATGTPDQASIYAVQYQIILALASVGATDVKNPGLPLSASASLSVNGRPVSGIDLIPAWIGQLQFIVGAGGPVDTPPWPISPVTGDASAILIGYSAVDSLPQPALIQSADEVITLGFTASIESPMTDAVGGAMGGSMALAIYRTPTLNGNQSGLASLQSVSPFTVPSVTLLATDN